MPRSYYSISILSCLILMSSCANLVKKNSTERIDLTKPNTPLKIPSSWSASAEGAHGKIATGWLREFGSSAMTRLVKEALQNNANLNAAAARLRSTALGTIGSRAAILPTVNSSGSGSRTRNGRGSSAHTYNSSFGLSLNASWEPDIWGRLRDLRAADLANYYASAEDYRAARLSLAANTAKAYCDLITAEQLLTLAEKTLISFQKNKDIVERNYKAGVPGTRAIAVQLSRTNVASAQRTIKSRTLQRDRAARSLEVLLGRYPAASVTVAQTLPNLKDQTPSSIPSALLARRPDLIEAQHQVYRSAKLADSRAKNLLPAVNLNHRQSTSSNSPFETFNPQNLVISIASSLSQSIYRGGELKANAKAALEQNKAAIYNYTEAATRAYREVENALAADTSLRQQEKLLIKETEQATFAERSAELDYSEGIENSGILEILESQRRANNARAALINIKNNRLQNRIDLHLALGGDFYTQDS